MFQARHADIECLARELEADGRARAAITGQLCTIAGFYRHAVEKNSSITPRPRTSAVPGSIITRTLQGWTVTSSGRCWSPPVPARPPSTR